MFLTKVKFVLKFLTLFFIILRQQSYGNVITFEDSSLLQHARMALRDSTTFFSNENCSTIEYFQVERENIYSLEGIECMKDLRILKIGHNNILNAEPLKMLNSLKVLDIV